MVDSMTFRVAGSCSSPTAYGCRLIATAASYRPLLAFEKGRLEYLHGCCSACCAEAGSKNSARACSSSTHLRMQGHCALGTVFCTDAEAQCAVDRPCLLMLVQGEARLKFLG